MNANLPTTRIAAAIAGLLISCAAAHGQLELSGTTYGTFFDPTGPQAHAVETIANGNPISTFTMGNVMGAVSPANPHSSVKFKGDSFDLIGSGDQDDFGKATITNGSDLMGTDYTGVSMELYADFSNIGLENFDLTTLTFSFMNTPNGSTPGGVPDEYTITAGPINSFVYDNVLVTFSLLNIGDPQSFFNPGGRLIPEKLFAAENVILGVTETVLNPVPEPATYALWGCALVFGAVVLKRRMKGALDLA
jgi:hypothetical protein